MIKKTLHLFLVGIILSNANARDLRPADVHTTVSPFGQEALGGAVVSFRKLLHHQGLLGWLVGWRPQPAGGAAWWGPLYFADEPGTGGGSTPVTEGLKAKDLTLNQVKSWILDQLPAAIEEGIAGIIVSNGAMDRSSFELIQFINAETTADTIAPLFAEFMFDPALNGPDVKLEIVLDRSPEDGRLYYVIEPYSGMHASQEEDPQQSDPSFLDPRLQAAILAELEDFGARKFPTLLGRILAALPVDAHPSMILDAWKNTAHVFEYLSGKLQFAGELRVRTPHDIMTCLLGSSEIFHGYAKKFKGAPYMDFILAAYVLIDQTYTVIDFFVSRSEIAAEPETPKVAQIHPHLLEAKKIMESLLSQIRAAAPEKMVSLGALYRESIGELDRLLISVDLADFSGDYSLLARFSLKVGALVNNERHFKWVEDQIPANLRELRHYQLATDVTKAARAAGFEYDWESIFGLKPILSPVNNPDKSWLNGIFWLIGAASIYGLLRHAFTGSPSADCAGAMFLGLAPQIFRPSSIPHAPQTLAAAA